MFVLIWATLLFSVRSSDTYTGASARAKTSCSSNDQYCITLTEGEITSEAGLCVVIPCSFTTDYDFSPQHLVWFKCEANKERCSDSDVIFHTNKNNNKVQSGYRGRVSLLEPDVSRKNCSIVINDLKESDSGSYQLRVNGFLYGGPDRFTYFQRATLSIKDLSQKPTLMIPPLKAGHQTTLTCTAPGLCSGSDPKITWTWRGAGEKDSHITGNITAFHKENLTAVTQRHSSTLTFNVSAEHHGSEVTCKVSFTGNTTTEETETLNVTYVKEVRIAGKTSVKEGETLNLTCSVESFPPSLVMWNNFSDQDTENRTETNPQSDTESSLQEESGVATLSISNVTTKDSGRYICTAKHLNNTVKEEVDVTVIWFSKILKSSACEIQSELLTCVCVSEGFPLPTIEWPLLENHTEYSVITTVSNHTVNSTVILTLKEHSNTSVQCVSSNEHGHARENLTTRITLPEQDDEAKKLLKVVSRLETIIAFLIGILLSAVICCLANKCHRKKQKSPGNLDETLEMISSQEDPLIYDGQAVEDDQTHGREGADYGTTAAEKTASEMDSGPEDVKYAIIDFSQLKRREAAKKPESTETEYAEIKKEVKQEREDNDGQEAEMFEAVKEEEEEAVIEEEEEAVIEEEEERKSCVPEEEEEEEEDMAVYSNVKDVMGEM